MIQNNEIRLRAPEPHDIDCMYRWENDPSILGNGFYRTPVSRFMLKNYVENYDANPHSANDLRLVIELISTGTPIGMIDLTSIDSNNHHAEIGVYIAQNSRGKGYGIMAVNLISNHCKTWLGLHQLYALTSIDNHAAATLFEKAGFATCGKLRSWIKKGHQYYDALIFQKLL